MTDMFNFFRKKKSPEVAPVEAAPPSPAAPQHGLVEDAVTLPEVVTPAQDGVATAQVNATQDDGVQAVMAKPEVASEEPELWQVQEPQAKPTAQAASTSRQSWLDKLKNGLRKTASGIASVFTGTQIDDVLYEELETALLLSDAGVAATEHLLQALKDRVKETKTTDPQAVKGLLADILAQLLRPLQKTLDIAAKPTVIMVAGVNGAGKTTSIGKLTHHLAQNDASVILAAADTFRAAAREQLAVWANRNTVEIISSQGGDPAALSFDAVQAGKARGKDVVLVDTAGRLPTQLHLMDELKKIKRVIQKADETAPHEVILVIDGNTGQNALAQVKAFDEALGLTGLIVTKLDGTAKGGVLAAVALWSQERAKAKALPHVPVYFIGVGEKLDELERFDAQEFAQALLG